MHMLIDQLVVDERRDLIDALKRRQPDCTISQFEYLAAAVSLSNAVNKNRPDVVVVDTAWLHLSALLQRILQMNDCWPTHVVYASSTADEIFRVQVAHRASAGHLDLKLPIDQLVKQLCEMASNKKGGKSDHLWTTVPLPPMVDDPENTAADDIDREILNLVSVGMQDADIAAVIHASPQTVKNRISAMLERSGLRNRTQLALMHTNQAVGDAVTRSLRLRTTTPQADYAAKTNVMG
jgi:DNA-binding NarL/FixJ family response regulator